jgi:hypothetical protein
MGFLVQEAAQKSRELLEQKRGAKSQNITGDTAGSEDSRATGM